jgi:hypothetical protein
VLVGQGVGRRAILARWDGHAVEPIEPPGSPLGEFTVLSNVSCAPSGECVVVGWSSSPYDTDLAYRGSLYTGTGWESIPAPGGTVEGLSCVTASWCVGVGPTGTGPSAGAVVWDGARWTRTTASAGRMGTALSPLTPMPSLWGVSCGAVGRCVAVGDRTTWYWPPSKLPSGPLTVDSLVVTLDGGRWTEAVLPAKAAGSRSVLHDVSCVASDRCLAAGSGSGAGPAPYALVLDGGRWRPAPPLTPARTGPKEQATGVSCVGLRCVTVGGPGYAAVYERPAGSL